MIDDPYSVLGLTPDASDEEVKRAYRALYRSGLTLDEARQRVAEIAATQPEVSLFSEFIAASGRGLVR